MKKTKHTDKQIAHALKQVDTAIAVAEFFRKMGIVVTDNWKRVWRLRPVK